MKLNIIRILFILFMSFIIFIVPFLFKSTNNDLKLFITYIMGYIIVSGYKNIIESLYKTILITKNEWNKNK